LLGSGGKNEKGAPASKQSGPQGNQGKLPKKGPHRHGKGKKKNLREEKNGGGNEGMCFYFRDEYRFKQDRRRRKGC